MQQVSESVSKKTTATAGGWNPHVFQSLCGMQRLGNANRLEWTLSKQIGLLRDRGLRWSGACFPASVDALKPILETVHRAGIEHLDHLNLQPDVRPSTVLECIPYILAGEELADDQRASPL